MLSYSIIKHTVANTASLSENEGAAFSIASSMGVILEKHNVIKHPFFQMWSCGGVTSDTMRVFVCQFYHVVKHFPRMLSAVHSNTSEIVVRKMLLESLKVEDGAKEHSAELWIRFAESLGISRDQLENTLPMMLTKNLLDTMNNFCRNRSFVEGLASLYAYESQLPELFKLKVEGLQKYYNTSEKRVIKFFTVRQEKDNNHSTIEKEIIEKNVNMENYSKVTYAAESTAFAFWRFLDGIMEVYGKNSKQTFPRLQ